MSITDELKYIPSILFKYNQTRKFNKIIYLKII